MTPIALTIAALLLLLTLGEFFLYFSGSEKKEDGSPSEIALRLRSWWGIIVIFSAALLLGPVAAQFFFGIVSFLALKEFFSMVPTRRADRVILLLCYLAIPVQYIFAGQAYYGMFIIFVPVYMFLLLPVAMVIRGETRGFLKAAGMLNWAMMSCVFAISHAGFLMVLPERANPSFPAGDGGAALLLYLVILTQGNDIAQFIWGKRFGKTPIVPQVSPNKTVEGFLGGIGSTVLLALFLAPWLTPFDWMHAMATGLVIAVSGYFGDVTISAIKRDIGVKDAGHILPGHGGVLDRIDSLTFTAPFFFHYVWYFYT